jgi:predicted outer membrane repeat protein
MKRLIDFFGKLWTSRSRGNRITARARRFVPSLECFEERQLPSQVFTVNVTTDSLTSLWGQMSLRRAITAVNADPGSTNAAPDTIRFAPGLAGPISLTNGELNLQRPVVITGPGAANLTIDAQGQSRVFDVSAIGINVTFDGLTITRGDTSLNPANLGTGGGGIENRGGHLTVSNCTLSGNRSSGNGGGIESIGFGILTVSGCILSRNGAQQNGGGIYIEGWLTVSNSTLSGNNSSGNGGGIDSIVTIEGLGSLMVGGCILTGNSANDNGGGIYTERTLMVSNSTLSGNRASNGGGIYTTAGTPTVNNSNLSGNFAWGDGGGIYTTADALTVFNSTLSSNIAEYGGGIAGAGTVMVSNSTLLCNNARWNDGGGIAIGTGGTLTVNNCTFSGNAVLGSGDGGGIVTSGALTVNHCTFSGNTAIGEGGGIFNGGVHPLTVIGSTFSGNTAGAGGGIFNDCTSGQLTVIGSTFSGNFAKYGGGIYHFSFAMLTVNNSTFAGNMASVGGGGAILIGNHGLVATLTSVTVTGNITTSKDEAAISAILELGTLVPNREVMLDNCIVAGNFLGSVGGSAADIAGAVSASSSYNLIGTGGSGGLSNGVNGNIVGVSDPGLGPLGNFGGPTQTMALSLTSPARYAGDPALLGSTDQRGVARLGRVSIGAYQADLLDVRLPVPLRPS